MRLRRLAAIMTMVTLTAGSVPEIYPDMENIFNIAAEADEENITIHNSKGSSKAVRQMGTYDSTQRWSTVVQSYVYDNNDGTFTVFDNGYNGSITADIYNASDYSYVSGVTIPMELSAFGGFYAGEKYNYIVFGQNNANSSNSVEVIRIVKYSKDFKRISSVSVKDCYTCYPFNAGSLRFAEGGGELIIHTARKRYDGHQSQLTLILDSESLELKNKNDLGSLQRNHVSHSFNQFVLYDNGKFLLGDHGDAYPRSIGLHIYSDGKYSKEITLMDIPGDVGANCTGVTMGGLEFSDTHYLSAINSIDHSKVTKYTSNNMEGLKSDERNIVILSANKETGATNKIYLTDYVDKGLIGSTPYLVKISDNSFIALWEEFNVSTGKSNCVKYVKLDGEGKAISEVKKLSNTNLSSDCQPTVIDNKIMWYINKTDGTRNIYSIDLEKEKTAQNITVSGIRDITYGETPLYINVTPDNKSGLGDFVFSSSNTDTAYFSSGNILNIRGTGETEITISQAGNSEYQKFTYTQKLTVNPRNISLESVSYGDKTAVIDGVLSGDDVSIKFEELQIQELISYNDAQVDVICSGISLTGKDAENYHIPNSTNKISLDRNDVVIADISCDNNVVKNAFFKGSSVSVAANTGLGSYVSEWILNGKTVSYDENLTLIADGDISLVAVTEDAPLGDVDEDGTVSSSDASMVLGEYAILSTGGEATFTRRQKASADVDNDKTTDSRDASIILSYYAYRSSGGKITNMKQWLTNNN